MKVKSIPSTWLREDEHRFDCGPFVLGSIETRKILEHLRCRKDHLVDLTQDGIGGMYHVGQDKLQWVYAPEFGVPFLRSADILKADLSNQPLISREQVVQNKLFQCPPGTTLITRSGTIGRIAYCRKEMAEMAISQDVLKVVPDPDKVPPGYLYAFLSSEYGLPLVTGGTFGSIVVHIEAENIADLPVPRLGDEIERAVHELVATAAILRSEASDILALNTRSLTEELELPRLDYPSVEDFCTVTVSSATLDRRLDAPYHSRAALNAEAVLKTGRFPVLPLPEVVKRCYKPPIFKRLWVDEPSYGRQFVSGNTAYHLSPDEARFVSRKTPGFDDFVLQRGWVVFQAAGQIYGLFGQPLFICGWLENCFCADDMYRLVPYSQEDGAFLYAFLRTPHGQVLLKRQACGNSIPRIWDPHMPRINVPWPDSETRWAIAGPVILAHEKMEQARLQEKQAVRMVEQAIEGAT